MMKCVGRLAPKCFKRSVVIRKAAKIVGIFTAHSKTWQPTASIFATSSIGVARTIRVLAPSYFMGYWIWWSWCWFILPLNWSSLCLTLNTQTQHTLFVESVEKDLEQQDSSYFCARRSVFCSPFDSINGTEIESWFQNFNVPKHFSMWNDDHAATSHLTWKQAYPVCNLRTLVLLLLCSYTDYWWNEWVDFTRTTFWLSTFRLLPL